MISIQRINAQGKNQNGDDYLNYLTDTEELSPEMKQARDRAGAMGYYHDPGAGETMRWAGKLAVELDLRDRVVSKEHMLKLAEGFHPHTGEALCKNAGEKAKEVVKLDRDGNVRLDKDGKPMIKIEGGHRVGFDLTFTPPKSVSLEFGNTAGDDKYAILTAHRRAVERSLAYLEEKVETRRGEAGRDVIGTKGLVIMQADHLCNRNLEPNLHTHNLIFGVSQGEDGKWGTFDAQELYRHRMAADQIYKTELASNLRSLGYSIEQKRELDDEGKETGFASFEIAGYSQQAIDMFSTRRQEILDYEREHGVDRQAACLATRKHKDEPAPEEMDRMWKDTYASLNESHPGLIPSTAQLKQMKDIDAREVSREEVLEKLHESEAVFCDHDLVARLGQDYMGKVDGSGLLAMAEKFKADSGLVRVHAEKLADEDKGASLARRHTEERYAAPWMIQWEQEVVHRVASRVNEDHQKLDPAVVNQAIDRYQKQRGFQLSDEQREAVVNITQGTGGVAILSGLAGTGKTTVSDCYSQAFRDSGRNMLGVCVSNAAARKLEEESGMPCRSVAKMLSMLDKGSLTLTDKDVLVVDEAGMLDTNQTRQLLSAAAHAGSKVVVQGDVMQLQPVGAGAGMSLAQQAVDDVKLTEMWRQSHVEDRAIGGMFYEKDKDGKVKNLIKGTRSRRKTLEMGDDIMKALHGRGCIEDFSTQGQAMTALVQDYLKDPTKVDEKLVIASKRVEVAALNDGIRKGLQERGDLPEDQIKIRGVERGKAYDLPLSRGDRMRFTKGDIKGLGVASGDIGTLEKIRRTDDGQGFYLGIRMHHTDPAKQRLVKVDTRSFQNLDHAYAGTVHKSQGQGKAQVYHLANMSMLDNHSSLVAFTRLTKGSYRMYGDDETIERLNERLGLERLKGNAITEGLKAGQEQEKTTAELLLAAKKQRQAHQEKLESKSTLTDEDRAMFKDLDKGLDQLLSERRSRERELSIPRSRGRGLTR